MKTELKLSEILSSEKALLNLANEKYPAKIAYRIQKNIRTLDAERGTIRKMMIDIILDKYGGKQTSPGVYEAAPDKRGECQVELNELLESTIEIDIMKIPLDAIENITPFDVIALEWMFEVPSDGE